MHRPFRTFGFLLLAGLALSTTGCGQRGSSVEAGNRDQIIHLGNLSEPTDLDPHTITSHQDFGIVMALFEGLAQYDPKTSEPIPAAAERWETSADGLTWTFHLRRDARWSNGAPVTAGDFLASFRRVLTPALGADYASMLYLVQGAEAYHKGQHTDFAQVGVAALDDRTLRLRLEHPAPHFLSLLSHPVWYPVHLPALEKAGSAYQRGNRWTRPETIVGNGPFVLREWRQGKVIIVEKSPTYWDAATVRLAAIHFYPSDSVEAGERAFRSGQLHLTEALPVSKVDSYRRDPGGALRISPFLDTYFYRLNVTRPLLNDRNVRRALSLAIDRTAIVEQITRGGQLPAFSFTPPGTAGYTPPVMPAGDLATARIGRAHV